ncbi:hypothetical protein GGQ68_000528 [Sagittula marina]|uniref:Uncharacterized protein n=1 Tax=Sagittula marina TaxID=943940 RepID=A0A7W6DK48_9RHOB|nr:hypothetical protein [Sagittula marina]MBB3984217.1 hypothetical protein [Sagittula marina]
MAASSCAAGAAEAPPPDTAELCDGGRDVAGCTEARDVAAVRGVAGCAAVGRDSCDVALGRSDAEPAADVRAS